MEQTRNRTELKPAPPLVPGQAVGWAQPVCFSSPQRLFIPCLCLWEAPLLCGAGRELWRFHLSYEQTGDRTHPAGPEAPCALEGDSTTPNPRKLAMHQGLSQREFTINRRRGGLGIQGLPLRPSSFLPPGHQTHSASSWVECGQSWLL